MSDELKQNWTQPAAMAIPKGGYVKDKVEQGRYGPIFRKRQPAMAFQFLRKSSPDGKSASTSMQGILKGPSRPSPIVSLCLSYTTSSGCSSRSRGRPISCIKASSIRTSTNTPRMPCAVWDDRAYDSVRKPRRLSCGLENEFFGLRQVRPRASLSEFSGNRGVSLRELRRNQESSQGQVEPLEYTRWMQ